MYPYNFSGNYPSDCHCKIFLDMSPMKSLVTDFIFSYIQQNRSESMLLLMLFLETYVILGEIE